ncbi:hypothetical protein [Azotobacter chroococcum]|uniref:hypothetical protein n=1 Tax=Azotobacter chroococcum TaxID=353 RepID=UPI001186CEE9|nr:hypothetical protein [Azotobacter chroococcum]
MANYFVVHRSSNLINGVIASSYCPDSTRYYLFIPASEKALTVYDKILLKDGFVDIGDLYNRSKYALEWRKDQIPYSDEGLATPQKVRYREEAVPESPNRESLIYSWLDANPSADAYDLNDEFCTGMLAAKAYFDKHKLTN